MEKDPQGKRWHRLDNTGKIFPMIANENLSNVFRISVILLSLIHIFARNRADWTLPSNEYTVQAVDTLAPCRREGWDEIQIKLGGCITPRLDTLFARQLGISRSQVKRLCEQELIWGPEGKAAANARVRDGQEFYVRTSLETEAGQGTMERASGDMGCICHPHDLY